MSVFHGAAILLVSIVIGLTGAMASLKYAARADEIKPSSITAVEQLKSDIDHISGASMRVGGVDTNVALKSVAEAIIAIDARLTEIERKTK